MECPRCGKARLVQIEVAVGGRQLTMRRCSHCDVRWWHSQGEELSLTNVLELASDHR